MKVRFVTTLKLETVQKIKMEAVKKNKHVNEILEELINKNIKEVK